MTRKDYVIVSTTGTILFLISIPWFLLVKNHLTLESPYFRVDAHYVQSEKAAQHDLAEQRRSHSGSRQSDVVAKRPSARVQLVNLPTTRVAALADIEPRATQAASPETVTTQGAERSARLLPSQESASTEHKQAKASVPSAVGGTNSPSPASPASTASTTKTTGLYGIQVGAFKSKDFARDLARQYERTGTEVHVVTRETRGKRWYRVIIGGSTDEQAAARFGQALQQVRGKMDTQLVHFQPSPESGKGDPR